MACAQVARPGPALLVLPRRGPLAGGRPYGHGLGQLGLDVARLLLVETASDRETLWALEEALRSRLPFALLAGALIRDPGLAASRRLSLAAAGAAGVAGRFQEEAARERAAGVAGRFQEEAARERAAGAGTPLLLLRPAGAEGASTAMTRWRIAAARSDLPAEPPGKSPGGKAGGEFSADRRWEVALTRCRNGRAGHWLMEWDHAAHRFRLARVLADCALPHGTRAEAHQRTG